MRHTHRLMLASVSVALVCGAAVAADAPRRVRIGTVLDGSSSRLNELQETLVRELGILAGEEFEIDVPADLTLTGDWSGARIRDRIDRLLTDDSVDLVVALGPAAGFVAATGGPYPKPVVVPLAIDTGAGDLPTSPAGGSGVGNLSYVAIPAGLERDVAVFRDLVGFRRLAILVDRSQVEAAPGLLSAGLTSILGAGVEVAPVPVGGTPADAVDAIPDDADAVFVLPLVRFGDSAITELAERLTDRKLPSFSSFGRSEVEAGLMASLRTDDFYPRLARRVALNIQRILLGEAPSEIPVAFAERPRLVLNMRTVRAVGANPPWDAIGEATLLHEIPSQGVDRVTLLAAVESALASNRDLAAFDRAVAVAAAEVEVAEAGVLPQLALESRASLIDEDRAAASFGSQPERELGAGLALEQVLYSEGLFAAITVQRRSRDAVEARREALRLDVVQRAATAYLDVLRADALYDTRRENLRVTRSNLELAQVRTSIGASGPSEVYRWQSSLATAKQEVVTAREQVHVAKVELNRVLSRDQRRELVAEPIGISSDLFVTSNPRFFHHVYSPYTYDVFMDFMVAEGIERAPELAAADAAVAAGRRRVDAARRILFVPTVGLRGSVTERLAEGGAGTSGLDLGPSAPFDLPTPDDTDWSIAVQASLPLFSGGGNRAELARARYDLERLEAERQAAAQRVEQRIRSALHIAGASYYSIELARDAATAARRSLELVTDTYAQGVVGITELLDAQAAALRAEEAAANAEVDFLIDLMEVERAVGEFGFFRTDAENEAFFDRLDRFFAARGIAPRHPGRP